MDNEQDRLIDLFNEALSKPLGQEREAYLAQACGADAALRAEVESLLRGHKQSMGFMKTLEAEPPEAGEAPGTVIGRYKLLQVIGEGGFGRVYMAEQLEPVRRKVALKIIKLGMDTREVVARFEAERQALALMDHPNIAQVHDGGATPTGRPYFVMELVKGIPLTDYCDREELPTAERLELFIQVCHAIQHAHQKGVIHRDLKPSNILVTLHDGKPVPKVIDFGIAKAIGQPLTNKTLFTRFEELIGTPSYMSPEQAALSGLDVDTRTDIYSLGVLLYELLTGTTPVEGDTLRQAAVEEIRRLIRETEPPKPSTRLLSLGPRLTEVAARRHVEARSLPREMRGDLDWIVMKALEKDRQRRYESAGAFAVDIERHLKHEPVSASPPSVVYRARKFVQRHKALTVAATSGVVGLALITAASLLMTAFARRQALLQQRLAVEKEEQRRSARQSLYFAHMRLARQDWEEGQIARMYETLREHLPRSGEPDQRGWEWYYLLSLCHREERTFSGHTGSVFSISVHPNGRWMASAGDDHTVRIWDAESGDMIAKLKGHEARTRALAWSPDASRLASVGLEGKLILWSTGTFQRQIVLDCGRDVASVAWSPDGKRIAVGGNLDVRAVDEQLVIIWDATTGERLKYLPGSGDVRQIWALAWQPGGSLLAGGGGPSMQLWDADTGRQLRTIRAHSHVISALAWSPDGKRLASSSWDQRIRVWDADTWEKRLEIDAAHDGAVVSLAWSPKGQELVSGGYDGIVTVWDARTGARLNQLRGHQGRVLAVAWWSQPGLLLSGGDDGCLKVWDPKRTQAFRTVEGSGSFAWSPDGRQLATAVSERWGVTGRGFINIWDVAAWRLAYQLPYLRTNVPYCLAWSPDARRLAASMDSGQDQEEVQIWDLSQRQMIHTVGQTNTSAGVRSLDWSPDGRFLLVACYDGAVRIWSLESKEPAFIFRGHREAVSSAAWHPDGRRIASKDFGGRVLIWEAATGEVLRELHAPSVFGPNRDHQVAWHPRGKLLAAGCGDGTINIWEAESGREVHKLKGHTSNVRSLGWSPDGRRLVSTSEDRTVRIWDAERGRELLILPCRSDWIASAAWSPNGRMIAVTHWPAWILDATVGYELGEKWMATRQSP
jgi:eukaryotic-like serine/threonine-protein kinase